MPKDLDLEAALDPVISKIDGQKKLAKELHEQQNTAFEALRVELDSTKSAGNENKELLDNLKSTIAESSAEHQKALDRIEQLEAKAGRISGEVEGADGLEQKSHDFWSMNHFTQTEDGKKLFEPDAEIHSVENFQHYTKGFDRLLRSPATETNDVLSLMAPAERMALDITRNSDGGWLVPAEVSNELIRCIDDLDGLASRVRVIGSSRKKMEFPTMGDRPTASWDCELDCETQEQGTTQIGFMSIENHGLSGKVCLKADMLDDASMDLVGDIIAPETADSFIDAEDNAILNGDGDGKPFGICRDKQIKNLESQKAGCLGVQDLINLYFGVNKKFRKNGEFWMHDDALRQTFSLKDASDRQIWLPSMSESMPSTLYGRPVISLNGLEDAVGGKFAEGAVMGLYGNFKRGYYMTNRKAFTMFRNPYRFDGRCIVLTFRRRAGGRVMKPEAIAKLTGKGV